MCSRTHEKVSGANRKVAHKIKRYFGYNEDEKSSVDNRAFLMGKFIRMMKYNSV